MTSARNDLRPIIFRYALLDTLAGSLKRDVPVPFFDHRTMGAAPCKLHGTFKSEMFGNEFLWLTLSMRLSRPGVSRGPGL